MNRVRHRAPGRFAALRQRYHWLDRLVRAGARYIEFHGYAYAASITYFTVLSLVPLVLVALSVAGFVLAGHPGALAQLRTGIGQVVPASLNGSINDLVDGLINHRVKIGVLGLVVALYSGWNWMNTLRDALTAMWSEHPRPQPLLWMVLKDILALLGLVAALLVSFGLTAVGGWLGQLLVRLAGLSDTGWVHGVLAVASVVLAVAANWLVFIWVLARLPRRPVEVRSAVRGALAAAIGFELLKWLGNVYLTAVGRSPLGVTFGWLVGLLVFIYLVARMLMLVAAWAAVGRTSQQPAHQPEPDVPAQRAPDQPAPDTPDAQRAEPAPR
jgi:membrane protein